MPPDEEPTVRIGMQQIYNTLVELKTKVEIALIKNTQTDEKIADLERDQQDHEMRIRNLEDRRWPLKQVAAITTVITAFVALVSYIISRVQ